jgi:hypothetical protein
MTTGMKQNEQARAKAIDKVARALGLWADIDGTMFLIEANGALRFTRHIANDEDLRKAQSYAAFLTQKIEALELEVASLRAKEMGKLGLTAKETYVEPQKAS